MTDRSDTHIRLLSVLLVYFNHVTFNSVSNDSLNKLNGRLYFDQLDLNGVFFFICKYLGSNWSLSKSLGGNFSCYQTGSHFYCMLQKEEQQNLLVKEKKLGNGFEMPLLESQWLCSSTPTKGSHGWLKLEWCWFKVTRVLHRVVSCILEQSLAIRNVVLISWG